MTFAMSRRSALVGAAAVFGTGTPGRAAEVDAVAVGAGAAGLAAARGLLAAGRSVAVLEARERIGGRMHTERRLGSRFDAGAQYIHWADRNPWRRIASELGIRTEEETGWAALRVFSGGVELADVDRARRRRAYGELDGLVAAAIRPDRSVADAVRDVGLDVVEAATGSTRLVLGEEPERVSAADYSAQWSGDDLLVPDGYGALAERFGQGLPVRLGTPVRRIRWDGPGVAVETGSGTIRARAAIVTVSIGVLQSGAITFAPALPDATGAAIHGLAMGAYTKIALRIDGAMIDHAAVRDAIDLESAAATTMFDPWPFGRDLVLAYTGGDFARDLCRAGEAAAIAHATERLAAITEPRVASAVTGGALADWWTDPYSRGSYSIAKPGRFDARDALKQPVGGRIWFAGEASAGGGAMTAGGAFLEGERAANEILSVLHG